MRIFNILHVQAHDGLGHDDHDHDDHPYQEDDDAGIAVLSPLQLRGRAVRNLLIARGILTAAEIRAQIEAMDSRGEHLGARVVVHAWTDSGFAARLAADAGSAQSRAKLCETMESAGANPAATWHAHHR
jgi:nitrile hydratase